MWMIDRGGDARFPLECGALLGVGAAFLIQDLESYLAIQILDLLRRLERCRHTRA
jgi:hypothetical protein